MLTHLHLERFRNRRVQGKRDREMAHFVHEASDPLVDFWEGFHRRNEGQMGIDELLCDLRGLEELLKRGTDRVKLNDCFQQVF